MAKKTWAAYALSRQDRRGVWECVTLSLTDAQQHLIKTADFRGGRTRYHTVEPRGYLVPLKDPEESK